MPTQMNEKKKTKAVAAADKKSSTKKASTKATKKEPEVPDEPALGDESKATKASIDFEAGVMFSRFDTSKTGVLTADEFRKMWRESKETTAASPKGDPMAPNGAQWRPMAFDRSKLDPAVISFEAGQIFSQFDMDRDGLLNKNEFEDLMKNYPDLLAGNKKNIPGDSGSRLFPTELISGRLLTHFDETAGVAIPSAAIDQHRNLGNTVVPLVESYRNRYDRLRAQLTSKLLPRREHLLQIRRQLQNTSVEITATRKGIERETVTDTEQILERLRSVESMRQSSLKHEMMQVEEELESIERTVRRVEQANEDQFVHSSPGVLLTSAMPGAVPVETVRSPRAASMVELIQQYSDISAHIDRLATKPLTVQIDFPTDDFPRETGERLEVISRCDKFLHALNVKDHMLWMALQEKKKAEEKLLEEQKLSQEYAKEIASWAEMSQALAQQVQNYKHDMTRLEQRNMELAAILRRNNIFYANFDA